MLTAYASSNQRENRMITLTINLLGLLIIGFIAWWFWLSKAHTFSISTNNLINIIVKNGVYQPARIQVPLHHPITLRFLRKDPSSCAEIVVFNSLNISKQLPLDEAVDVQVILDKPGEYEFTCQMGMYRGKIIAA